MVLLWIAVFIMFAVAVSTIYFAYLSIRSTHQKIISTVGTLCVYITRCVFNEKQPRVRVAFAFLCAVLLVYFAVAGRACIDVLRCAVCPPR